MPSSDIGGLPPLFKGALQGIDLVIVDVSGSETKRISVADLLEAGFEFVPDGIPWDKIENGDMAIADGAITEIKLADGTVTPQTGRRLSHIPQTRPQHCYRLRNFLD